jgi:hypothetical protein
LRPSQFALYDLSFIPELQPLVRKRAITHSAYESLDPAGGSAGLIAGASGRTPSLVDLNFEECVIGVFVAPLEVLLLLGPLHFIEIPIIPMLFLEIGAVSAIFVVIPCMVVLAASIVVAFFLMVCVVSPHYDWAEHGGAQHQRAQN